MSKILCPKRLSQRPLRPMSPMPPRTPGRQAGRRRGRRRGPAPGPPLTGQIWVCPHPPSFHQLVRLGYVQTSPHQLVGFGYVQSLTDVQHRPRAVLSKSSTVDWRVAPDGQRGPREARSFTAPLQAPGTAGPLDGEVLTNKSSQGRADAQRLVATRLLDRVHDPLGHFSRLQRIYPRAR
jgi:hypothetical protein